MSTFGERILERRTHLGLSQDELAKKASVSRVAISKLELGESQDTRSTNLFKIAEALKCSPSWLLTGKGDPLNGDNIHNQRANDAQYSYPKLDWVNAGMWNDSVCGTYPEEWISTNVYAGESGFWLDVKGDSMTSPNGLSIYEGMQVLVSPQAHLSSGRFVVARINGSNEATLKKYVEDGGNAYLMPLNPQYPTLPFTKDCSIEGVVVEIRMKV
ncbi:LexA family protein [Providencia rettgeri]